MTKKITMKIKGMQCPNCPMILERIEDKLKGVMLAKASYHKEQMVVEYDEHHVTEDQIKSEIQRLGYEVIAIL